METIKENTHEVIQNSDKLYKSEVKWIDSFEPKPINDYEKNMLKGTRTIEEQLAEEKKEEEIKIDNKKQLITKVKVIALDKMGKAPLSNPSLFKPLEKEKLIKLMEDVLKLPEDEISILFNTICNEKVFTSIADYSTFPMN